MAFSILGLSTALPAHRMSTDESLQMSADCVFRNPKQARLFRTIVGKSQIENRHLCVPYRIAYDWVPVPPSQMSEEQAIESQGPRTSERMELYAEHASGLAVTSSRQALHASGVSPREITHLVTVSCTGFEAPGVDIDLMDDLGLAPTVERIHIGFMGCHGALNGMRATLGLTSANPDVRVLLCATELCSLHFCFSWDPKRILGNALFADGSAAMICGSGQPAPGQWQVSATGSCLLPDSRDAITWRIGDHGYEMSLSSQVPELIQTHLRPWLETWLAGHDLTLAEIGSWAIHPGGPKIIDAVTSALSLSDEASVVSRQVLRDHGNMSSPTILFIIDRLQRQAAPLPCVAIGFGPGLVAECALIR